MGFRNLKSCVDDLERGGHLIRVDEPINAHLEAAEIHRRVFRSAGPALLFTNVQRCRFPMLSNLFGTMERARFIFRDTIENVKAAIQLKVDPAEAMRNPLRHWRVPWIALQMLPKSVRTGAVRQNETTLSQLPQLKCWPDDGGAFITLPQVYTENVASPGLSHSNLGMYRVQISGNDYIPDRQVGLHYQIHRGIGVHHRAAIEAKQPFRVNIFVGGNPAMTVAAVMPLPEGITELGFAGALAGHRIPMIRRGGGAQPAMYADADFCISGTLAPDEQKMEGPFGDHLGYYSLAHEFPVLNVDKVYHRHDAIWPFTVVGRPPQEDTIFGELIHELTGPVIPTVLPGVKAVHAVDAAGVHPLLLAVGGERYVPYRPTTQPQEILTQANAILGQGQMSLAKYLWIIDEGSVEEKSLDIGDIKNFFARMLERVDWTRDLHFQTRTTIDTLDYSGSGFNEGSKVVIAAAGPTRRHLPTQLGKLTGLPDKFTNPQVCLPGVLAIEGPAWRAEPQAARHLADELTLEHPLNRFPLIVIVDDSEFCAGSVNNWVWVVFTRSNPATDIYGIDSSVVDKHWGCRGSLVIDARIKEHHAPPLIEDPEVSRKVDALATRGGPLSRYL